MKKNILTVISAVMILIPWTILPLRTFEWALVSPVAEIMIYSYAAFMIFSGVFTITVYGKEKVQNGVMKICCVINGMYAVFGIVVLVMAALSSAD